MDVFIEELVRKKRDRKDLVKAVGLACAAALVSIVLFNTMLILTSLYIQFSGLFGSVFTLLIAGVWFMAYKIYNSFSVEYEYIVINSSLDVDKIMAKRSRKRMTSIDIKNAELMACVDDNENNSSYKHRNANVKIRDYSAGNEYLDTYFIEYNAEGQRQMLIFQPTQRIIDALWKFNPKAVKKYVH